MAKSWVRQHEVQRDEVQDFVDSSLVWIERNRQMAATVGAVCVAAVVLIALVGYHTRVTRAEAWERLAVAESTAYAGRPDAAVEQLKQLANDQPGSDAAGFAQVFAGDLAYQQRNYKDAADSYLKVVERAAPRSLQPVALFDLAISQEAGGQPKDAAQTAQRFLDTYPDHFLAPQAHACLARSLAAAGQNDQARATLQKIVLQYPDTVWAAWAQSRLK